MKSKKTLAAMIVARQGSSRHPKKATLPINGRPLLQFLIERLREMKIFNTIILATSDLAHDQELIDIAKRSGASAIGGDPEDVLRRMAQAAEQIDDHWIVEIGGDCPLVDRQSIIRALEIAEAENADYVTNTNPQTFPDGLDIHLVKRSSLIEVNRRAALSSQRLHPFTYFYKHPELFKCKNFENTENLSRIRLTLDWSEDYEVIRQVVENIEPSGDFGLREIVNLMSLKPEIFALNAIRNLHQEPSEVPGYWYTNAYIMDLLNDLKLVSDLAKLLEENRDFTGLNTLYKDLSSITQELKERAAFFEKRKN